MPQGRGEALPGQQQRQLLGDTGPASARDQTQVHRRSWAALPVLRARGGRGAGVLQPEPALPEASKPAEQLTQLGAAGLRGTRLGSCSIPTGCPGPRAALDGSPAPLTPGSVPCTPLPSTTAAPGTRNTTLRVGHDREPQQNGNVTGGSSRELCPGAGEPAGSWRRPRALLPPLPGSWRRESRPSART